MYLEYSSHVPGISWFSYVASYHQSNSCFSQEVTRSVNCEFLTTGTLSDRIHFLSVLIIH